MSRINYLAGVLIICNFGFLVELDTTMISFQVSTSTGMSLRMNTPLALPSYQVQHSQAVNPTSSSLGLMADYALHDEPKDIYEAVQETRPAKGRQHVVSSPVPLKPFGIFEDPHQSNNNLEYSRIFHHTQHFWEPTQAPKFLSMSQEEHPENQLVTITPHINLKK
ncbi:hypothetical protein H4Q26_013906 [Puccinia striiformis f. sp. tritici PST-130]|nr:hypothetical protein H4Q26_013906 [Puccinia striiformis f. sp. tritici PST-130]